MMRAARPGSARPLTALGLILILLSALLAIAGPGTAAAAGLPSGLLARYAFDAGDASDSSGNGNNGTLVGSPGFVPGPGGAGSALAVNLNQYVTLPSTAALGLYDQDFTVAAWVNASAFSGLGGYGGDWALLGNQSGPDGLHLVLRDGRPYMGFLGNDLGSGSLLQLNTWYHIAWRYTKATGQMTMFLNGNPISSGGGHPSFKGTGATYIGRCCQTWDSPRYAKGMIDDVQIYGRALTQAEVGTAMQAPAIPAAPPAPASCTAILLAGNSTGDGIYTIDPAQNGNPISVYCDMSTDGGGWTLAGYGANANLAGRLNVANGAYNPTNRAGSANINAVALARQSTEVALSWSGGTANGALPTYQQAVTYAIPNPAAQTLDPVGGGYQCLSSAWSPVTVKAIVGTPNLPAQMYTRTASLGAVYGLAYGLSRSNGNPQCDWTIDGQAFRAVYLGINSPGYARGVVYEPGGSANHVTPATMAIWFRGNVPVPPQDSTVPVITPTVSGTLGGGGWYTSNVSVTWAVVDAESALTATSGCGPQTVTADTAGTVFTCTATSAGGSATASVSIKRDATAPAIAAAVSPADNGAGWYNSTTGAPTVSFTCSDGGSGVATCTAPVTLGEGAGQSVSGAAADVAGNTAGTALGGINVDLTPPSVAVTGVADGATYTLGAVPTAGHTCTDGGSGVATSAGAGAGGNANGVGSFTYTAVCADDAGNSSTVTATYAVVYGFGGFLQPIPQPVSTFKAGSTIPVKFRLTSAGGMSVGTATAAVSANGGPALGTARYDADAEQYIFNLKTKGLPAGPLTIAVTLDDGTTQSVTVTLK